MRNIITITLFLIVCFFSSAVFAADKERESITDLTPWKGIGVSMINLYNNEAGERFYEEILALLPEGYTKKMVKDFISDFFYMKLKTFNVVDGNTIIIDDKFTGDYIHVCTIDMLGEDKPIWRVFKTDSKEMIEAGFKYILLLPFHQHGEDSVRHTHFRYGNEDFDFLTTDPSLESWFPTLYQPANTDEAKATKQMTTPKMARMLAGMVKKNVKISK